MFKPVAILFGVPNNVRLPIVRIRTMGTAMLCIAIVNGAPFKWRAGRAICIVSESARTGCLMNFTSERRDVRVSAGNRCFLRTEIESSISIGAGNEVP
jgi:hypothetical protein